MNHLSHSLEKIQDFLASKMCHDLIGSVGAINNGLELMEDATKYDKEALQLIRNSGRKLSDFLQYYRVCYGVARDRGQSQEGAGFVFGLIEKYMRHTKINCDFSMVDGHSWRMSPTESKMFLNIILVMQLCMPRGGSIKLLPISGKTTVKYSFAIVSPNAELTSILKNVAEGIDYKTTELTTHNVQEFYTFMLLEKSGHVLSVDTSKKEIILNISEEKEQENPHNGDDLAFAFS